LPIRQKQKTPGINKKYFEQIKKKTHPATKNILFLFFGLWVAGVLFLKVKK